MTSCPAEPRAGDPISATWMAKLVRYVRSIRPLQGPNIRLAQGPNGTVITAASASKIRANVAPRPYEVKWAQEPNESEGGWIIYLTKDALIYDDNTVDQGLTEVGEPYAEEWKELGDDFPSTGESTVYLIIDKSSGSGEVTASFATAASPAENTTSIPVAYLSRNEQTKAVSIRQNLVGALVLSSGSGSGSSDSTSGENGTYNIVTGIKWDENYHRIVIKGSAFSFTNGLLTGVVELKDEALSNLEGFAPIVADPHSGEHSTS